MNSRVTAAPFELMMAMSDDQVAKVQKASTDSSQGSEQQFLSSKPGSLEELRPIQSHKMDVTHVNSTATLDSVNRYSARFHSCSHAKVKTEYKTHKPQKPAQAEFQRPLKSRHR